jgi:hypothetical protein
MSLGPTSPPSTVQSAVCARFGDVASSPLYTGDEYLAYKDVQLVLQRGFTNPPTVQDLEATFTLRYTKGNKKVKLQPYLVSP